jgi:hypothetical protein
MRNIFLIIILIIVSSGLAAGEPRFKRERFSRFYTENFKPDLNSNEIRLPKNIIPYYYQLYFKFHFTNETEPSDYLGTVRILMKCNNKTNKLILNVKSLEIDESSIIIEDLNDPNIKININNTTIINYKEVLIIEFEENFEVNHNYTISIDFKGFLRDDDHGLFRLSYLDKVGNKKYVVIFIIEKNSKKVNLYT